MGRLPCRTASELLIKRNTLAHKYFKGFMYSCMGAVWGGGGGERNRRYKLRSEGSFLVVGAFSPSTVLQFWGSH